MSDWHLEHAEQLLNELESTEQKLQQLQDGLMQSQRLSMLGTVSATVAHEFNNLLTPVISYCQYALSQCKDGEPDIQLMHKALEKSLAGAEKAAAICSSMLGFARESMALATRAPLDESLHEVLTCIGREPAKDGIEVIINIPDGLAVAISPVAMQQVLMNLVLNARTAMRPRGGKLTVTATVDQSMVQLTVTDTGCGIEPELLPRIFEPFVSQRTVDQDSKSAKGTGLGLAICRQLLQQAGGSIAAESQPGQGTTFHITLPMAPPIESPQPTPQTHVA